MHVTQAWVVFNAIPILTSGWKVTVNEQVLYFCDVQQTCDAHEKQEVHFPSSDPDDVSDIRDQFVRAGLRYSYRFRSIEMTSYKT